MMSSSIVKKLLWIGITNLMHSGIYCQSFDRWLLINNQDFWITLETARVLSSKIATTVYVFSHLDIDNDDCLEYMLLNKTKEKRVKTKEGGKGPPNRVRKKTLNFD